MNCSAWLPVLFGASLVTATVAPSLAKEGTTTAPAPLRRVVWSDLAKAGRTLPGTVLPPAGGRTHEALRVTHSGPDAKTIELAVLPDPGVKESQWALRGRMRYENVTGQGYFQLWNEFPDRSRYFTRTVAPSGPLQGMSGTSDWREFVLPFDASATGLRPSRLVVELVLPGSGVVEIGPLELIEGTPVRRYFGGGLDASGGAWWNDRTAGFLGAVFGSLIGIAGAGIGMLMRRGRAPRFVRATLSVLAGLGAVALAGGFVALGARQPYAVWYPLLLIGFLLGLGAVGMLVAARKTYREQELRKMAALDLMADR